MRKRALLILFLSLCGGLAADDLSRIRGLYHSALQLSTNENCHTMTMRVVYAAIGLQTTTINFFHVARQVDPEKDPYWMAFDLALVTVTWNIAASVNYRREYLYSRAGELLFCFDQEVNQVETVEHRYYWSRGALFRKETRKKGGDKPGVTLHTRNFSRDDLGQAALFVSKAKEYVNLFKILVAAEKTR